MSSRPWARQRVLSHCKWFATILAVLPWQLHSQSFVNPKQTHHIAFEELAYCAILCWQAGSAASSSFHHTNLTIPLRQLEKWFLYARHPQANSHVLGLRGSIITNYYVLCYPQWIQNPMGHTVFSILTDGLSSTCIEFSWDLNPTFLYFGCLRSLSMILFHGFSFMNRFDDKV